MVFSCLHCGTTEPVPAHLGPFDLGEPTNQQCPICSSLLHHATVSACHIRVCAGCGGTLSPMSTFASVVNAVRLVEGQPVVQDVRVSGG